MEDGNDAKEPVVEPGDWIRVGRPRFAFPNSVIDAVVCSTDDPKPGWIEVVYLEILPAARRNKKQRAPRALQSYVVWDGGAWAWAQNYPNEGYADYFSRLTEFVLKLNQGRPRHG